MKRLQDFSIAAQPFEFLTLIRRNLDIGVQGEPARAGGTVRLAFRSLQPWRNRLQRRELLPRPRPHRDAVGDRAAEQIIQRTGLRICGEPGILQVALDQAATFQRAADASGDLLDQLLQVARLGSQSIWDRSKTTAVSSRCAWISGMGWVWGGVWVRFRCRPGARLLSGSTAFATLIA